MTSEVLSDVKFEIGHVLFIDIVGYSKLLMHEQSEQLQKLKEIVRATEQLRIADAEGKLLRLPTGDGGALVFRNSVEAPVLCAMEISKVLKQYPQLRVRMGIHSGPVNEIADLNEQANIAGAGINIAQRVMDCGDAGHILLSKHVAEDLEHFARWQPYLHELGECEVKHGRKISLVNFYNEEIGNSAVPDKIRAVEASTLSPGARFSLSRPMIVIGALVLLLAIAGTLFLSGVIRIRPGAPLNAKSIAVLPFENLSRDPENAYFADGIQEEILSRLSKIDDLKVISRTSTQRFKSKPENLSAIAKQLGVANVLEGTIQKMANQVRVNVQLINAQSDSHLWADKFDRQLTDIFAVESEIATKIADTLEAKLSSTERSAIAKRPTANSEAHDLYLKGRYFVAKRTADDLKKALDYFSQAIAKDPSYAAAYAGLADTYVLLPDYSSEPAESCLTKAKEAATKAVALDDGLAEAHASLGLMIASKEFNIQGAKREFTRAIELDPNYSGARYYLAVTALMPLAEFDDAIAQLRQTIELDPFSVIANTNLGYCYYLARRYAEAIAQLRKTVELEPNFGYTRLILGTTLMAAGDFPAAMSEFQKGDELERARHGHLMSLNTLARLYAMKGDREKTTQLLKEIDELERQFGVWNYGHALSAAALGENEKAIEWLERSYSAKETGVQFVKSDPMLDPLRGDPRFEQLVQKIFGESTTVPQLQAAESKSIAVLPFENLSADPNNAYFADGIQEEILTRLSKIADLKVISRTSTQRYKSAPDNLREIGDQLGVAHVLEGSVQKAGDQVRVNVQLINALTDSHLWAEKFDRHLTDIFVVESEIAAKIADTLKAKLTGAEEHALTYRPTENTVAHELYLRARHFANNRQSAEDLLKAIDYYNRALTQDPNYALAHAGLAEAYAVLPTWQENLGRDPFDKSKAAAQRALALDENLAEAHIAMSLVHYNDFDLKDAKRELERAIALDPNNASAHYYLGRDCLTPFGQFDRAIAEIKTALSLDPLWANTSTYLGFVYMQARRYPEAIAQLRKTLQFEPNYSFANDVLGCACSLDGRLDEAIELWKKSYDVEKNYHSLTFVGYGFGRKGDRDKALQVLGQLQELEKSGTHIWIYGYGLIYLGLGDRDKAIECLERSWQTREPATFIPFIRVDPMLDPLRGDPRFEKLANKIVPADVK
jgi:TolB-like protein/Tfp pilus assembly protein PilF